MTRRLGIGWVAMSWLLASLGGCASQVGDETTGEDTKSTSQVWRCDYQETGDQREELFNFYCSEDEIPEDVREERLFDGRLKYWCYPVGEYAGYNRPSDFGC